MWPLPTYTEAAWEFTPGKAEHDARDTILTDGRLVCEDGWKLACEIRATRFIRYPFYPGAFSIEIQVDLPFGEGRAVGAWLVVENAPADGLAINGEAEYSDDGGDGDEGLQATYFLNGTSPPIHEANAKLPVSILDEETAEAYLKFFCAHVWSDAGGFWIVSGRSDIPFHAYPHLAVHEASLAAIQGPEYQGMSDDGQFLFRAWVCYGGALFVAHFAVQRSGMIEMLDDKMVIESMGAPQDRRIGGLRAY